MCDPMYQKIKKLQDALQSRKVTILQQEQAGAELGQAHVLLKDIDYVEVKADVEIVIEVGVQLLAQAVGGGLVGGWTQTKLMLNSTQVEVEVEAGVELGNI